MLTAALLLLVVMPEGQTSAQVLPMTCVGTSQQSLQCWHVTLYGTVITV
jgi:hypothetical protein